MKNSIVTVLIPTYKHKKDIERAVDSVKKQTISDDCHIIISDDCSPDDTYEYTQKIFGKQRGITVRQNTKNLGIMPHYVALSKLVETKYVAILEGDDFWIDPNKLSKQLDILDTHPEVGFCFCGCRVIDELNGVSYRHPNLNFDRHQYIHIGDILNSNPMATFSCCFYRTDSFQQGAEHSLAGRGFDWLTNMSIALNSPGMFAPFVGTAYRLHANGTWTGMPKDMQIQYIRDNLNYLLKIANQDQKILIEDALDRI
ncbi:glycosyltransferase involved in cell wall biosynthesis [Ochrobactrum sp. RH1CCR137]|nr:MULTISPECIES: glycosyltransferase family 2 protein [unclassified Ochrobactrum]MBA8845679.1 glycosyltransferase involved in cell wall biosynthesis [Ochrobactrum sp. RH1CCR137]MBA8857401.1 glycosyltransferase involved in cell wall biosynthesis [Ochrobactrum sp. RH1CCR134]